MLAHRGSFEAAALTLVSVPPEAVPAAVVPETGCSDDAASEVLRGVVVLVVCEDTVLQDATRFGNGSTSTVFRFE